MRLQGGSDTFPIYVFYREEQHTFKLKMGETVGHLKRKILKTLAIPTTSQILTLDGRLLPDSRSSYHLALCYLAHFYLSLKVASPYGSQKNYHAMTSKTT